MLFSGTTLLEGSTTPDFIMLDVADSAPGAVRVTEEIVIVTAIKFAAVLKGTVIVIVV